MPQKRTTGSRFKLGEPCDQMLNDFCAVAYGASATEVIRRAVQRYIEQELDANPGIKDAYEAFRKGRDSGVGLRLVKPSSDGEAEKPGG